MVVTGCRASRANRREQLRQLRVDGHQRGLSELVNRNRGLVSLSFWHLPVDRLLPTVSLPALESLSMVIGSLTDPEWLGQFAGIRQLALRVVRKVADLDAVRQIASLEWLWLENLSGISRLPDMGRNEALVRVDIDGL